MLAWCSMFGWLHRLFGQGHPDSKEGLLAFVRAMNSAAGGGAPTIEQRELGVLPIPSGTLALVDPQYVGSPLEIGGMGANQAVLSVEAWRYPSGAATVRRLTLRFDDDGEPDSVRQIGTVPIDSAKIIVADKVDLDAHWAEKGPDRIGVITLAPDDTVLKLLTKRFGLRARPVNIVRAEVIQPISESLEAEIEAYLREIPEYADFPFMHFHVQTNNGFDRANFLNAPWAFLPIGNAPEPQLFACTTGDGDGTYPVRAQFVGKKLRSVTVDFIADDGDADP